MPFFKVNVQQLHEYSVFVEADNAQLAGESVFEGESIVSTLPEIASCDVIDFDVQECNEDEVFEAQRTNVDQAVELLESLGLEEELVTKVKTHLNTKGE